MNARPPLTVALDSIAPCFEGITPASICSCSREGLPNVTFLSIVHRLDDSHVGLSFQFFNKTRKNTRENPRVQVIVVSPATADQYRLDLQYLRTETDGPAFDRMNTRLEAVASQSGMSRVFRLRGVDVYEVLECRPVSVVGRAESAPKAESMRELESFTERLGPCEDLDALLSTALEALADLFEYRHSFVMFPDEEGTRLYTAASYGFEPSGVGSEVVVGEGMLGLSAERRSVVRITNLALDMLVARAVRSGVEHRGEESILDKEIALPGLPNVQSQLVLPLLSRNTLLGVLCLQSPVSGRFLEADERVMQIVARHLAASMANMMRTASTEPRVATLRSAQGLARRHAVIKHYRSDDSIFIDDAYLTKGIPGRLFWKLLQAFVGTGRAAFTNKEIRLDASLGLPDIKDNLETRLILLRRRLDDRCEFVKLIPAGRGHLRLEVRRRLTLEELP
jgi:GAF domain-containing protein/pyridoxamine 5'-phosphate oxidase-like protein